MNLALRANLIHELFDAAVDLPAEQRARFLLAGCDDASVRADVHELLEAHDRSAAFLADPTVPPEQLAARFGPRPGSRLDRYTILQRLGEGGHGTVYLAQQDPPHARRVALKVIKAGMDTGQVVARFNRERESLGRMDHPNIARVFDAGVTEGGRPFFAMEWVDGDPITDYCRRQRLDLPAKLGLFVVVCGAIQHAHDRAILHRDLKPANVLVTGAGGTVTPKVIDFGIAKAMATDEPGLSVTTLTVGPQVLGTPQYMSPEQADPSAVPDVRTDVYGLGGLLYELLTGSPPLDRSVFAGGDLGAIARVLREVEPVLPSARLIATGQALRSASPEQAAEALRAAGQVRGPLDWIVAKALSKDRARRYPTAEALAGDVRRYLAGEPVTAGGRGAGRPGVGRWAGWAIGTVAAAMVLAATVVVLTRHPTVSVLPPRTSLPVPVPVPVPLPLPLTAPARIVLGPATTREATTRSVEPALVGPPLAGPPLVRPVLVEPALVAQVRITYAKGRTELAPWTRSAEAFTTGDATFDSPLAELNGMTFTRRVYGDNAAVTIDADPGAAVYLLLSDGPKAARARAAVADMGWTQAGAGRFIGRTNEWNGFIYAPPAKAALHVTIPMSPGTGQIVFARQPVVVAPPPPATTGPTGRLIAARWGSGQRWADVTARVADLLVAGEPVWADPDTLGADPWPGWHKHLEVTYEIDGERDSGGADEGNALDLPALALAIRPGGPATRPATRRARPGSGWIAPPPPPPLPAGFRPGLVGTVYGDMHFGKRVGPRVDGPIDFFWPDYVPPVAGMDVPKYSIRWTGSVIVPAGGATIGVEADDGARLTIDGRELFAFADPLSKFSPAPIPAGRHTIRLDYWNRLAGGRVRLLWRRPGDVVVDVPATALCHAADEAKRR